MDHPTREEMLEAFGPFAIVFEPIENDNVPYLSLLHLYAESSLDVLRLIRQAVDHASSSVDVTNARTCIVTMLRNVNWRPHLVGSIATFYAPHSEPIGQMWAALDAGSWVTPQIAGILSKCDSDFQEKALIRLDDLCPLSGDAEYSIDSPLERHSAQGPAGSRDRSSKAAAALHALLTPDVRASLDSNVDLQNQIATDVDNCAELATSWLQTFLELDAQL